MLEKFGESGWYKKSPSWDWKNKKNSVDGGK
jgi:hypothetical protein